MGFVESNSYTSDGCQQCDGRSFRCSTTDDGHVPGRPIGRSTCIRRIVEPLVFRFTTVLSSDSAVDSECPGLHPTGVRGGPRAKRPMPKTELAQKCIKKSQLQLPPLHVIPPTAGRSMFAWNSGCAATNPKWLDRITQSTSIARSVRTPATSDCLKAIFFC